MAFITTRDNPLTLQEAQYTPNAANGTRAVEEEFMPKIFNNTWKIFEKPNNGKVIGKKMVFRIKNNYSSTGKKNLNKTGVTQHQTYSKS